ncbi:MAG: hypothetical protein ABMA25_08270 [Ilumatobacteraceae bacterium]
MRVRRLVECAAVVALALGLSGCSEMNANALTRIDGEPAVLNCGTWIHDVEVRDADSGRLVWSARLDEWTAPSSSTPASTTTVLPRPRRTNVVVLGTLPSADWSESTPLELEPEPSRWEFVINGRDHLMADDSQLQQDRYITDGAPMSFSNFRKDVCNDDAGGLLTGVRYFVLGVLGVLGLGLIIAVALSVRGSRRKSDREPGYYMLDGQSRYWNGTRWN